MGSYVYTTNMDEINIESKQGIIILFMYSVFFLCFSEQIYVFQINIDEPMEFKMSSPWDLLKGPLPDTKQLSKLNRLFAVLGGDRQVRKMINYGQLINTCILNFYQEKRTKATLNYLE